VAKKTVAVANKAVTAVKVVAKKTVAAVAHTVRNVTTKVADAVKTVAKTVTAAAKTVVKAGDKVLAADTKTGKDQPETVTAVLVHHDTDLYNLTVKTSTGTEVIHTTTSHLFWDAFTEAVDSGKSAQKGRAPQDAGRRDRHCVRGRHSEDP
jgi:hypothetical protein